MADNLEYNPPELYGLETFRCDEEGNKDPNGYFVSVKASAKSDIEGVALSVQLSKDDGTFDEPQNLIDGVPLIIGNGTVDPSKIYHVCYSATDNLETVFKIITLYVTRHRATLGYFGGGFGIEPPEKDNGYYFIGDIKVPIYDEDKNIIGWRTL